MATPPYIAELRRHVGHAPLWLMGANVLVVRDGEVLLVRRSDTGEWAPIGGIVISVHVKKGDSVAPDETLVEIQ